MRLPGDPPAFRRIVLNMTPSCSPLGFPRSVRMTDAKQFEAVFRRPEFKKHTRALRIRARENRMHGARLGMVIAKRQVPKANDRNRLKRVCRETFRLRQATLPAVDIVVQVMANQGNRQLAAGLSDILDEVSTHFVSRTNKN